MATGSFKVYIHILISTLLKTVEWNLKEPGAITLFILNFLKATSEINLRCTQPISIDKMFTFANYVAASAH